VARGRCRRRLFGSLGTRQSVILPMTEVTPACIVVLSHTPNDNAGGAPVGDNEPPTPGLTAQQRRVLEVAATGATTPEVAIMLGLSVDEVREHVRGAVAVLGAGSKLEALLIALRQGLVRLPPVGMPGGPGRSADRRDESQPLSNSSSKTV